MEHFDYKLLVTLIEKNVQDRKSATITISASSSHSGVISIKDGEIIFVSYAHYRGLEALDHLTQLQNCNYNLLERVFHRPDKTLPSTREIIERMRPEGGSTTDLPTNAEPSPKKNLDGINQMLDKVRARFAQFLGPIAVTLFELQLKEIGHLSSLDDLRRFVTNLAQEIDDQDQANDFLRSTRQLIGLHQK